MGFILVKCFWWGFIVERGIINIVNSGIYIMREICYCNLVCVWWFVLLSKFKVGRVF